MADTDATQYTDDQLIAAIAAERDGATRHQQAADQHTTTRDQLICTAMTRRIRRADIATAAGVAESRLYQITRESTMLTITDLAAAVGMSSSPQRVAAFAGCFTKPDARTGRIPQPWHGQGMAAVFTPEQAERLIAEWHRAAHDAEAGRIQPIIEADAGLDPAAAERRHAAAVEAVRERYRP